MNVTVVGAGWVGVIFAGALARLGHHVTLTDVRAERIASLERGDLPFFEPGVPELLREGVNGGNLRFAFATDETVRDAQAVMCTVGTPPLPNGAADVSAVYEVARQFGRAVDRGAIFIVKSTVPPGTGKRCQEIIGEEMRQRNASLSYTVASNPEFLAEGTAVADALKPERMIIGVESERGEALMRQVYEPLIASGTPTLFTDIVTAELTKYAANAFLATKISFINEMANMCELTGASAQDVARGIGMDTRIGSAYLRPGIGYGGSCLPKDIRALIAAGREAGYRFQILPEVDRVNMGQRVRFYEAFVAAVGGVRGKRIVLWGLSYKPGTDDIREAPSLYFLDRLIREGATVVAYDPKAMENARALFPGVEMASDPETSLKGAHALALLTEWPEFGSYTLTELRTRVKDGIVLDARGFLKKR